MEQVTNIALKNIEMAEPAFQRKSLQRLKCAITNKIDTLKMPEERKSYFLHQLANVHDLSSMEELISDINNLQLKENIPQDIVHIVMGSNGIDIQGQLASY